MQPDASSTPSRQARLLPAAITTFLATALLLSYSNGPDPRHTGGFGEEKFRRVVAESIDAAIARTMPGIFPLLVLGIDPGNAETTTYYASSAWGAGCSTCVLPGWWIENGIEQRDGEDPVVLSSDHAG